MNKGCTYCTGNVEDRDFFVEEYGDFNDVTIRVVDNTLSFDYGYTTNEIRIRNCPMCGRSLKE